MQLIGRIQGIVYLANVTKEYFQLIPGNEL
jgi:hypothetical protein